MLPVFSQRYLWRLFSQPAVLQVMTLLLNLAVVAHVVDVDAASAGYTKSLNLPASDALNLALECYQTEWFAQSERCHHYQLATQWSHACYSCTSWWWRRSSLYDLLYFTNCESHSQFLIECPQFNHLRQQYHFGSTLKDLCNNTSVNDIIAFIKDTHFYTRI